MSEQENSRDGLWIEKCYLEQLPRYDPEIYRVKNMSSTAAQLYFKTAFNFLLFVNQVVSHCIYGGTPWDKMNIAITPEGGVMLRIKVRRRPERNKLDVEFDPNS